MIAILSNEMARRNVLRGLLGGGLVAAELVMFAEMTGVTPAEAARFPHVHRRAEWHALPPRRPCHVRKRRPDRIIVHHTATANTPDRSLAHAFRLSRKIQRQHMRVNGWDDIGEHLTISRGGHVLEGRSGTLRSIARKHLVVGAQSMHNNDHTLGIENEGDYRTTPVPVALMESLVGTCAWLCMAYDLNPHKAIVGHRDLNTTDCPGAVLYERLPEIRERVAAMLAV